MREAAKLMLPAGTLIYPAHEYKGRSHSTIGAEIADIPRLKQTDHASFVDMMQPGPDRTDPSDRSAAHQYERIEDNSRDLVILDVREKDAFLAGHIPGALHLPRRH